MTNEETQERVKRAFKATRIIGLPDEEVKPILWNLWMVFDKNWEPIEAENYRALFDAYFTTKEDNQGIESGKKGVEADEEGGRSKSQQCSGSTRNGSATFAKGSISDQFSAVCLPDPGSSSNERPKKRLSGASNSEPSNSQYHTNMQLQENKDVVNVSDISKGVENVKISLVDEKGKGKLPKFTYMSQNVVYQNAYMQISLARISDEDCCSSCSGDCLSSEIPCACARETGGEFAYTKHGLLKEEFLDDCMRVMQNPKDHHFVFCKDCPLERSKDAYVLDVCKGHLIRKFIKECWIKCGCDMNCGNRVVQRGLRCNLQVFMTGEGKGWGIRTVEKLAKGTFICEYVGEILTNTELYDRNLQINGSGSGGHTYPVTLDADWGSERLLKDEEALCLDATFCGNVARFINHRCNDANLIDIPVEVETPDRHYYHLAFFTNREVGAMEELTWDYGIDFEDDGHPIKAFACYCGSAVCRDRQAKRHTRRRSR